MAEKVKLREKSHSLIDKASTTKGIDIVCDNEFLDRTVQRRIMDFQNNGIGDVIIGCWIIKSAEAIGEFIRINPRNLSKIPKILSIGEKHLTFEEAEDWTKTSEIGLFYEYGQIAAGNFRTRFQLWCESLGLTGLKPVRPHYQETSENTTWANNEWCNNTIAPDCKKRVLVFPDCAWGIRTWPRAYFIDLIAALKEKGYAVTAMAGQKYNIDYINCFHMWGLPLDKVAAMINSADLIIGNDTGPTHLSGTINKTTVAICGPTDGKLVFGHDENVLPVFLNEQKIKCKRCHFNKEKGLREALKGFSNN